MRRRILRRLIWVYAICICFLFEYIQPVPQMRTVNFRLAAPLHVLNIMVPLVFPGHAYLQTAQGQLL